MTDPQISDSQNSGLLFRLAQRCFLLVARITRGMTLGVRVMVLDNRNQVFLVRHSYVKGWHLPGGGVDAGETLDQAARRELLEEANIVVNGEMRLIGIYLNRKASARDHVAVYVARDFLQSGPRLADREIVEAGFFPLDNLPDATTQATRRRIREVLENAPPDQDW